MLSDKSSFFKRLWSSLIEPGKRLVDPELKSHSRLLSSILVIFIPFGILLSFGYEYSHRWQIDFRESEILLSTFSILILIGAYIINRAGWYTIASAITLLTLTVFIFFAALPGNETGDPALLYYLVFPILISSILMPVKYTALLVLGILFGMIGFGSFVPGVKPEDIPLVSTLLITLIVLLASEYRTILENDRRKALVESEKRFRTLVEHAPEAILVYDADEECFIDANENATLLFGLSMENLLSIGFTELFPANPDPEIIATHPFNLEIEKTLLNETPIFEWVFQDRNKKQIPCSVRLVALPAEKKRLIRASIVDLSQDKEADELMMHLATHDQLTDLPNRSLFMDRLSQAILSNKRSDKNLAVLYLDLDNFQDVNEAFSRNFGDVILQIVTRRLQEILCESDTVARLSGDEFAVLIEGITDPLRLIRIAEKMIQIISEPINMGQQDIYITSSIGISVYPENGSTPIMLTQNADMALSHAKRKGKNTFQFYSPEMETNALERVSIASDLRKAIEENKFELYYQPQIHIADGTIRGMEALLRWNRPSKKYITPKDFIPIAEESGLIVPLGEWVIRNACMQNKKWIDLGFPPAIVSVNISEKQLQLGQFVDIVKRILEETGLPPQFLELELTENIILDDNVNSKDILYGFNNIGVQLAVDDFGTGYSTLSQLSRLPFDVLKIDRSFTYQITENFNDAIVVSGILSIAQQLGLEVIAEGIESEEHFNFFKDHNCNTIQGYYFSKPLQHDEMTNFLFQHKKLSARLKKDWSQPSTPADQK